MTTDEALFAQRVLHPTRPRLAATRVALAAFPDPRAAWEALAPPCFPGSRRSFWCTACQANGWAGTDIYGKGIRCPHCSGLGTTDAPSTMEAVLAMCTEPREIATAEELAVETARRYAPWSVTVSEIICWHIAPARAWPPHERMSLAAPGVMLSDSLDFWPPHLPLQAGAQRAALGDLQQSLTFEEARRRATPMQGVMCTPEALVDQPLGELPNPFAPQVELWRLGYGLLSLSASAIRIFCPIAEDT